MPIISCLDDRKNLAKMELFSTLIEIIMTRIMISECICPACGIKLDVTPSRKKKCPSCNQFMFVRTIPSDRKQYLVTKDEEEEYKQLFDMPLSISINRKKRQSLIEKLSGKKPVPIRWVIGPWCKAHCRRIAGHLSCLDVAGEYDEWDCLPTVPGGEKLACTSDEFMEWWYEHHTQEEELSGIDCDCHLELFLNGKWTNYKLNQNQSRS